MKEFGKTHEQIVDGSLYIKIDEDYASTPVNTKKFEGSLVSNSNIQSSFLVTTQSGDVTGNFGLNSKLSMNLKDVITKQESTISGKFEYGVVKVDLDNNLIVLEAINKDGDKYFYLKIGLTDKLIDMFLNQMNSDYVTFKEDYGIDFKQYLNTYVRYNAEDIEEKIKELDPTIDFNIQT